MNWEDLTAPDFAKAVKKSKGVCIITLGCIEKHGEHLPLGTDMFAGLYIAREAARREPAVVFPPYYLTQICEARHQPGTIAIGQRLMWDLLEACCDEAGRNGFTKILLHNAHGGNNSFIVYFQQMMLEKPKPYTVYSSRHNFKNTPEEEKLIKRIAALQKKKEAFGGHAGEGETSMLMHICPELVKMKDHIAARGVPLPKPQPNLYSGIWWYAEAPHHYVGQAELASPELGKLHAELAVLNLIKAIKAVKADRVYPKLEKEFFRRAAEPKKSV